jgi:hypothetical protein
MFRRVKRDQVPNRLSDEAEPNRLSLDGTPPNELDLEGTIEGDFEEDLEDDFDEDDFDEEDEEEELSPEERARRAAELQAELQRQAEEFGLTGEAPVALYGPNGEDVAELLDSLTEIDDETAEAIAEAYWATPDADRRVARSVVSRQHRGGELELELRAAERAVTDWHNALDVDADYTDVYAAVAEAATDAVDALILEDELADIDFDTLYGPWADVMESDEDEDEDEEEGEGKGASEAGEGGGTPAAEPEAPESVKVFIERLDAREAEEAAEAEGEEGKEFGPNEELVLALLGKLNGLDANQVAELVAVWREQPKGELRIAHRNLQDLVDEDPRWREQLRLAQEEVFAWMAGRGGDTRLDYSFGAPKNAVEIRRPAGPAVADAVAALVMADILEPEDAEVLYAPWAEVVGEPELPRYEDEVGDGGEEGAAGDGEEAPE